MILPNPIIRPLDANGEPVPFAKLYAYEAGTTTAAYVYLDSDLQIPAAVPVVADASGQFPELFTTDALVKIDIKDSDDVSLPGFPVDNANKGSLSAANGVTPLLVKGANTDASIKSIQRAVCVLRSTAPGEDWDVIDDASHKSVNFADGPFTVDVNGALTVPLEFDGLFVGAAQVTADESYASLGVTFGASVGVDNLLIRAYKDLSCFVNLAANTTSAHVFFASTITCANDAAGDGSKLITHPDGPDPLDLAVINDVLGSTGYENRILAQTDTSVRVATFEPVGGTLTYDGATLTNTSGNLNPGAVSFASNLIEVAYPSAIPSSFIGMTQVTNMDDSGVTCHVTQRTTTGFKIELRDNAGAVITSLPSGLTIGYFNPYRIQSATTRGSIYLRRGRVPLNFDNIGLASGNIWVTVDFPVGDDFGFEEGEATETYPGETTIIGKSAYESWLDQGNTGTEADFIEATLGDGAYSVWLAAGNVGTEADYLADLEAAAAALAQTEVDAAVAAKTAAETAETGAETARDKAEDWAEEAEDVEVETGQYSAKHYSLKAAASASASAASASAVGQTTSYSNEFGQGDRTASALTVSSAATGTLWSQMPAPSILINGNKTADVSGATRIAANLGVDVTGLEILRWDFGPSRRVLVNEVTLWWNNFNIDLGAGKVQGSQDGTNWEDISGALDLDLPNLQTPLSMVMSFTNLRGFRYYRILGTSGTTAGTTRYLQELELKTAFPSYDKKLAALTATQPGQTIIAKTTTEGDIGLSVILPQNEVISGPGRLADMAAKSFSLQNSDYYIDSVQGDDTSDGLTPTSMWETLAKLRATVEPPSDGIKIGIRANSVFPAYNPTSQTNANEISYDDHSVAKVVGGRDGAAPVISFGQSYTTSDTEVEASDHVDATADVLMIDLSRFTSADLYTNAPSWMASEEATAAPRVFYEIVASVADVASTPGSVYFTSADGATTTAHFHPFDSTSTGKTFVFPYSHGVNLRLNENSEIEGLVLTDCIDGNGAAVAGNDSVLRRLAVGFMGKHHFFWSSGLVEDCIAWEKPADIEGFQFVMYQAGQDIGEGIMIGCRSIQSSKDIENTSSAIYSHSTGLQTAMYVTDYISLWGGSFTPNTPTAHITDSYFRHKSVKSLEFKPGRDHQALRCLFQYDTGQFGTWITTALSTGQSKEGNNTIIAKHCGVVGGAAASAAASSGNECTHDWQHNVTYSDTDGNAQAIARMDSDSTHRYNIHVVGGPRSGGVLVYVHPVADSDYNIYGYVTENSQSFSFRDLIVGTQWTSITYGSPEEAFAAYQAAHPTKDQNSIVLGPDDLDRLFLNGVSGLAEGDFRLNPYSGITFADGTPVYGIAGIQEWYDFNERSVKRGAPSRFPTAPTTWAECQEWRDNPRLWDHYPEATPAEIIAA